MKIIDDCPNYSIDENGVIINNFTGKIIKPHTDINGYQRIGLRVKGKQKKFYIHRLVAGAFIENPKNKETVNHKNGVKSDNSVVNLEWMTNKENLKHAYDTGLKKRNYYTQNILVKKIAQIVLI